MVERPSSGVRTVAVYDAEMLMCIDKYTRLQRTTESDIGGAARVQRLLIVPLSPADVNAGSTTWSRSRSSTQSIRGNEKAAARPLFLCPFKTPRVRRDRYSGIESPH